MHTYIYIYIYVYTCVCIYIYIYIYRYDGRRVWAQGALMLCRVAPCRFAAPFHVAARDEATCSPRIICLESRGNYGCPKEWGSQVTTGSIVLYSQFFACSSPPVDRCSNPSPWDPLISPYNMRMHIRERMRGRFEELNGATWAIKKALENVNVGSPTAPHRLVLVLILSVFARAHARLDCLVWVFFFCCWGCHPVPFNAFVQGFWFEGF